MNFQSIDYLLFLPLVAALYFLFPYRLRWLLLLVASNIFYASWRLEFLALLWFTTLVDYGVARAMPRHARGTAGRKLLLAVSLCANIGLLCFFKYSALLEGTTFYDYRLADFTLADVILPLGISFYTFQTMGYTIDVYRGKREPETHLGIFGVYVMYFPQLLAGPIERPYRLLPQLRANHDFELRRAAIGASLITLGYFKKLVIADRLGSILPDMLGAPESYTSLTLLCASIGTTYRYYADLSGYADIAIGSSIIMGIRLSRNFNRPFAAVTIADFWARWHITVTTWFRDYVFLPLARVPHARIRRVFATILAAILIGIWHGASLAWLTVGVVGGVVMALEAAIRRNKAILTGASRGLIRVGIGQSGARRLGLGLNCLVLWIFLVLIGSMINAPNWEDTFVIWHKLADLPGEIATLSANFGGYRWSLILLSAIVFLELYQWLDARRPVFERLEAAGAIVAWPFWCGLAASIVIFGMFTSNDFLYFHF